MASQSVQQKDCSRFNRRARCWPRRGSDSGSSGRSSARTCRGSIHWFRSRSRGRFLRGILSGSICRRRGRTCRRILSRASSRSNGRVLRWCGRRRTARGSYGRLFRRACRRSISRCIRRTRRWRCGRCFRIIDSRSEGWFADQIRAIDGNAAAGAKRIGCSRLATAPPTSMLHSTWLSNAEKRRRLGPQFFRGTCIGRTTQRAIQATRYRSAIPWFVPRCDNRWTAAVAAGCRRLPNCNLPKRENNVEHGSCAYCPNSIPNETHRRPLRSTAPDTIATSGECGMGTIFSWFVRKHPNLHR